MGNFYDRWLGLADERKEKCANARTFIHEEELEWVRTKQDYRAALLSSPENGFLTAGEMMLGEIPPRCNTGKHYHGEEAIYIVKGKGCSIIDGMRYDWEDDSCLFIPFGVPHQHFNLGDDTVRYFSAMALTLEILAGVAKVFQFEDASETHLHVFDGIPIAPSDIHPELGRIIMREKDAPVLLGSEMGEVFSKEKDEYSQSLAQEMRTPGPEGRHRKKYTRLMRWADNEFKAREVEITGIFTESPGTLTGKHCHMEAILYCLEGEGCTIIDGKRVDWKKGTLLQIPGPETVHQHATLGTIDSREIRVHFGLRSRFYQPIVKRVFPYRYHDFARDITPADYSSHGLLSQNLKVDEVINVDFH